jgi:hypothetical protein
MFIRSQLLYDRATRVVVYQSVDGQRSMVPDVSEDLMYCVYTGEAPNSFTADRVLEHMTVGDFRQRNFRIVARDADFPSEMPRLKLLAAKCNAMWRVYDSIRFKRRLCAMNLPCQTEVYSRKEAQARELRRRHAEGTVDAADFPYVRSYAELYGMAPIDAAEFMLLKAEERAKVLEVTEHQRLYWTKKVMDAASLAEIERVNHAMVDERFRQD